LRGRFARRDTRGKNSQPDHAEGEQADARRMPSGIALSETILILIGSPESAVSRSLCTGSKSIPRAKHAFPIATAPWETP
jgi:hypothetical protein